MYLRKAIAALAGALLATIPLIADAQQQLVQDPERFERQHFSEICQKAMFDDGFAKRLDINNDGLMDMVIDEGKITCDGQGQYLCNEEGCPSNYYVQVKEGGYILIATARIYGYDFKMRFGNMVFVFRMHPRYCDRTEGDPCEMTVRVRGTRFVTINRK
ncbi:hypothetical protein [Gellertiella hungarica]|uniref:Uncharacterized protein n=1 Tax=Gellertiella hungarica TaxID=1572859 RepID=A0A7W6J6V0_9HYPH|nr:hypothetical protein [Gellertiella hungarica]MBB4065878.1 hypothetical protein [Gellertiella hungarica]